MKKQLILIIAMVALLACALTLSVCAEEIDPNSEYYDKVYTDANGRDFPIYEKEGDTYHPLVWFAYEDGEVTKYVKARFEDINCYSLEPTQGRFNGCYYNYTDENGNTIELDTKNLVVLNLRAGVMAKTYNKSKTANGTNITVKTIETNRTDVFPSWSRIEAVYIPLTQTTVGSLGHSSLRVCDIDKNHPTGIGFSGKALQDSKIREIFIPGGSTLGGNSQFQGCTALEKVVFGKGFSSTVPNYFFDRCSSLKLICFMGDKAEFEKVVVNATNNGVYTNATKVSASEYEGVTDKSKTYVVYGCTECIAFNGGVHTPSSETVLVGNDFFSTISVRCPCSVEGCLVTVEKSQIAPIVEAKGYSASTFGETLSVTQGFYVNQDALDTYLEYVGELEIGLVATVNVDKTEFAPDFESAKVTVAKLDAIIHSYIDIKITGIPTDKSDALIVFCMYITVDENTYFLDGGVTGKTVLGKSYTDVLAITE